MFIQNFGTWIGKWLPFDEVRSVLLEDVLTASVQWMCTAKWKVRDQSDSAGAIQVRISIEFLLPNLGRDCLLSMGRLRLRAGLLP